MNNNKICFITCVNDEEVYKECLLYIRNLIVPDGFELETIAVNNAEYMTKAYNVAMTGSNAKYKIYLHQDVFIINKNFISNIVDLFRKNPNIGLLGVAGAKAIPVTGVWWESAEKYGKVYDSHTGIIDLLEFKEVRQAYEKVKCLDGLILVTQYDVPWREDIFTGWHFYDVSQSLEFDGRGYDIAIPRQYEPWCIHDCGIVNVSNGYKRYKEVFLDEYSKTLFPLVSILIPAYNQTVYLETALESALNQDYRNCEIIICDDSTTYDVQLLIAEYQKRFASIKYYNNGGPLGGKGTVNFQKCFDISEGEYISYLLHDDLYMPNRISTMVRYLMEDPKIKLVTSYRKLIDGCGNFLPDLPVTKPLFPETTRISGEYMGKFMLQNIANVIGEPTTAMFRRSDIHDKLLDYHGERMRCLGDVAMWLKLMIDGDLVYIREPLSCFRIHTQQNTCDAGMLLTGPIDWYKLIVNNYDNNRFIPNMDDYRSALTGWMIRHKQTMDSSELKNEKELYAEFLECYQKVQSCID